MKAKQKKPIIALDLGTTKFCFAILRQNSDETATHVETCAVPADGMRRGMLSNMEHAKRALTTLIDSAERQFGCDIHQIIVGVAGSHLRGRRVRHQVTMSQPVTHSDVKRLLRLVEEKEESDERELLHVVPLGYRLNHGETIDNPVGFSGATLTGDFFVIDADRYYLKDIVALCNHVGLRVTRLYSEPFASASVTVPDAYKQLGVAVADIGGGTTDGIVFQKGKPVYAFTVNVAGKLMTGDVAIGLNLSLEDAEKVKIRFGLKPRVTSEMHEVRDLKGQLKRIGSEQINPILGPRVRELGTLLARELYPFKGLLGAGLLLTGGGAEVKGIEEFYHQNLGIPVSRARPSLSVADTLLAPDDDERRVPPAKFATAIGLINLELCRSCERTDIPRDSLTRRYLGQFVNWIKELT